MTNSDITQEDRDPFDPRRPPPHREHEVKAICERLLPAIRANARLLGWAVAVHGSMVRDLDLVATPWTEEAASEDIFVEAVCFAVAAEMDGDCYRAEHEGFPKPHGRRVHTLTIFSDSTVRSHAGAHPFIDLSIVDGRLSSIAALGAENERLREAAQSVSTDIALFAACCAVSARHEPNWSGIKDKAEEWVLDLRTALAPLPSPPTTGDEKP